MIIKHISILGLIFLVLITSVNIVVAEDVSLKFISSSTPQTFPVYKGQYVDIPVTILNQAPVSISCTVSSPKLGSKNTNLLNVGYQQTLYFRYNSENKIKGLQSDSPTFTTNCQTSAPSYWCPKLNSPFETCYYVSTQFSHSVTVNFDLSPQDKQNLAVLENYKSTIATKITNTDSELKTLKDLIDKTPTLLLPSDSSSTYSNNKQNFDLANSKFNKVKYYLEEEIYDYVSDYTNLNSDVQWLGDIDSSISYLTNEIIFNINAYNEIIKIFNEKVSKSSELIKPYSTKSNADIIEDYDSLTDSLKSKFEGYQFSSLEETKSSVESYKNNYNNFVSELKNREREKLNIGLSILKKEFNSLPSSLITGNVIENNDLSLNELCNKYGDSKEKVDKNNQEIYSEADNILRKLSYNTNSLDSNEKVEIYQSLNENVTLTALNNDKEIKNAVKEINHIGKKIDLGNYSNLVNKYNSADLADKKQLLEKINDEKISIIEQNKNILSNENGFLIIFKKIYYSVFGEKQEVEKLDSQEVEKLINLSPEFTNFHLDNCNTLEFKTDSATSQNISTTKQQSDINTNIANPEATCIDENGQRTTNCCNTDEYKSREDLYSIIFVHGHASETGQKTVQSSLATFNTMQTYFSNNGYVTKDILFPEKISELNKGIWGYCKPVSVRITYYDGISTGGSVQYKGSIADYSPTLNKEINAVLTATNKDKAIIVAHSMGGIISRYYILNDVGKSKIDKLITISSPHYGTNSWTNFLSGTPKAELESKEMQPGSPFLNLLNYPSDSLIDSYSIMGDSKACDLGIGERCDGVIYVNDAKLKQGKDFILFKGSQYEHSSIVNQQNVSKKVLEIINN